MDCETARVLKSSYDVVNFDNHPCLLDYALLKLETRLPRPDSIILDARPHSGYLAELQ